MLPRSILTSILLLATTTLTAACAAKQETPVTTVATATRPFSTEEWPNDHTPERMPTSAFCPRTATYTTTMGEHFACGYVADEKGCVEWGTQLDFKNCVSPNQPGVVMIHNRWWEHGEFLRESHVYVKKNGQLIGCLLHPHCASEDRGRNDEFCVDYSTCGNFKKGHSRNSTSGYE